MRNFKGTIFFRKYVRNFSGIIFFNLRLGLEIGQGYSNILLLAFAHTSCLFTLHIPLGLKRSVTEAYKFPSRKRTHKTKATEWRNELKPTEDELKMFICLYLNQFNESKLMFRRTLIFILYILRFFYKSTAPANIKSAAFGTVL